ncbi:MAG: hypothetical protein WA633_15770 [Stellaceae bacterium]
MSVTVATLAGLTALALSVPAAQNQGNWVPLGRALSFELGDQACGEGRYQALWRDWRGDWWWGPCVPNR